MNPTMLPESLREHFPPFKPESKPAKEFSLCLPIWMGRRKEIAHNLFTIDVQMFRIRQPHGETGDYAQEQYVSTKQARNGTN
jgi:hypothetical protein